MDKLQSNLKERVDRVLRHHPMTEHFSIETIDDNGTIFLMGMVDSQKTKDLVEKLVKMQKGVKGIVNEVVVASLE